MKQNNYLTKRLKVSDKQALLHNTVYDLEKSNIGMAIKWTTHTSALWNLLRSVHWVHTVRQTQHLTCIISCTLPNAWRRARTLRVKFWHLQFQPRAAPTRAIYLLPFFMPSTWKTFFFSHNSLHLKRCFSQSPHRHPHVHAPPPRQSRRRPAWIAAVPYLPYWLFSLANTAALPSVLLSWAHS